MTDKIWTDEMAAAMRGTQILSGQFPLEDDTNRMAYYAASCVAPVDLVPHGERAALKERDEALEAAANSLALRLDVIRECDEARRELDVALLHAAKCIGERDDEIARLQAQIAGFTAANIAPATPVTPEAETALARALRLGNRAPTGIIGGMGDRP